MKWRLSVFALMAAAGLAAADPPYVGQWKFNPARSDFGQFTMLYEQLPDGQMKVTAEGQTATFKIDGNDYPTPWGDTMSYKSIDDHSWETTGKLNGKVVQTGKLTLSADGKTLNIDSKVMKADGTTSDNAMVLQRVSGGPGLAGKWKTRNVKITSPGSIEIGAPGTDGIVLKFADEGGTCDAKFDGTEHPATGKMWPSGWTCLASRRGTRGFDVAWRRDGQLMFTSTFTVSGNGQTLTDLETIPTTSEKIKLVYDRVRPTS